MAGKCYKRNFIKKVISQIDFAEPTDIFTEESIADAVKEIKKRFPIAEQKTATQGLIEFKKSDVSTTKEDFSEWVFHGEDRKKILKVNKLFINIVLLSYSTEDDFKADLIAPISHLLKINPTAVIKRTGVRFVNVFDFEIESFSKIKDYFAPAISQHLDIMSNSKNSIRSFLINEYSFDDLRLREQTGLFNPDYPAIIKRNHFVIDLDASINIPHQINDVEGYFGGLHHSIEGHFESLITDKLRDEVLNG